MKTKADARPGCSANHPTECEAVARLSNFKTSPINAKWRHPDPPVLHPGVSRPPDPPSWGAATQNPTRSIFGVATPQLVGFGKSSPLGSGLLTSVFVLSRPPALQFYCLLPCVYYSAILLYPVRFCSHIFSGLVLSPLCPTSIPFPSLSLFLSLSLSSSLSLPLSLSLFVVVWPSPSFLSPSLKPSLSPPRISRPLSFCLSLSRLSYFGSACSGSPRPHHHHYGHVPAICPPARPARPPAEKPNVQVQSRTLTDLARILRRVDQTISRRGLNADPLVPVAAAAPPTEASSPSTPPVALSEAAALDSVSSGRQGRLTHK